MTTGPSGFEISPACMSDCPRIEQLLSQLRIIESGIDDIISTELVTSGMSAEESPAIVAGILAHAGDKVDSSIESDEERALEYIRRNNGRSHDALNMAKDLAESQVRRFTEHCGTDGPLKMRIKAKNGASKILSICRSDVDDECGKTHNIPSIIRPEHK